MATNAFNSIYHHHHHQSLRRRHSIDCPPPPTTFLRPTTTAGVSGAAVSLSHSTTTTSATTYNNSTVSPTTSSETTSFDLLRHHLTSKNYREADEETRRLLIALAGEAAVKRGYVFFSEVQFIAADDLRTIDDLWKQHSDGKFGYSVQKRIWNKASRDFTKFFIKVGWMKKLESSEVEQYNYRAFPAEFMWEIEEGVTPEGHLPLTNALRGTQLLTCILNHPAFEGEDDEEESGESAAAAAVNKPLSKMFKTSYTF